MKRIITIMLTILSIQSKAQQSEHISEINNLYECLHMNGYYMDKELSAILSDLNLNDSTKYYYSWVIRTLPNMDSINKNTLSIAKELYQSLYSQSECKFLAEQVFQGVIFLSSIPNEYSKQKQLKYLSILQALDNNQSTEEFLETSAIRSELLESIKRRRDLMERYGIYEVIKYLERSLILKQCFNP